MSRLIITEINKAIKNNRGYFLIPQSAKLNTRVLTALHTGGFIQGLEFRGAYVVVYLKLHYWKSWGIISKSMISASPLYLSKRGKVTSQKWQYNNSVMGDAYCTILTTDRGITNNKSNKGLGGIPLLKIL